MRRKLLFVTVAMCLSPLMALAQFSGNGSGTAEDPYQITNADELYQIRSNLTSSFVLMNDIDLTDWLAENSPVTGWPQLGTADQPYAGVFDGNGYTIKYFINDKEKTNAGLFACLRGTIKNLNVIGTLKCFSGGGVVGRCSNGATISDCTFRGEIVSSNGAGGIAESLYGTTINRCSVSGTISGGLVGGIVGHSESWYNYVDCCSFFGDITASDVLGSCGGIVGGNYAGSNYTLYISNCFYQGRILSDVSSVEVGGIAGYGKYSQISNCIVMSPALKSIYYTSGIARSGSISSCVVIVDTLQYSSGYECYRIGSTAKGDGTSSESLALATMVVKRKESDKNDVVKDGTSNGISMGRSMLMKASTYTSHFFDLLEIWDINEGKGYPYLRCAAEFMNIKNETMITGPDTDVSALENTVYAENAEANAGSQLTLSVKMKNAVQAEGFGFDLYLPDGITVVRDEDGFPDAVLSTERTTARKTNSFNADFLSDGALRVFAASTNGSVISGSDGEVCRVTIDIADDMEEGDYPIVLKNVAISDENAVSHRVDKVKSTITITSYQQGDANNDGVVDVSDFTAIAHYLLSRTPDSFNAKAADANVDGTIDVADLTAVSHLIIYGSVVRPALSRANNCFDPQ